MNDRSMRDLNLLLRFVLELLVLLALFLWGVSVTDVLPLQVLLGIGAPVVAMLVWGLFVSPRASRRLPDPQRLVVEVVIFGAGALALAGHRSAAAGAAAGRRCGPQPVPDVVLGPTRPLSPADLTSRLRPRPGPGPPRGPARRPVSAAVSRSSRPKAPRSRHLTPQLRHTMPGAPASWTSPMPTMSDQGWMPRTSMRGGSSRARLCCPQAGQACSDRVCSLMSPPGRGAWRPH